MATLRMRLNTSSSPCIDASSSTALYLFFNARVARAIAASHRLPINLANNPSPCNTSCASSSAIDPAVHNTPSRCNARMCAAIPFSKATRAASVGGRNAGERLKNRVISASVMTSARASSAEPRTMAPYSFPRRMRASRRSRARDDGDNAVEMHAKHASTNAIRSANADALALASASMRSKAMRFMMSSSASPSSESASDDVDGAGRMTSTAVRNDIARRTLTPTTASTSTATPHARESNAADNLFPSLSRADARIAREAARETARTRWVTSMARMRARCNDAVGASRMPSMARVRARRTTVTLS